MQISYDDVLQTIADNAGEVLATVGGNSTFTVDVTRSGVCFIPLSTGKPRPVKREDIELYLDRFKQTRSTKTTDYRDKRNASYVLSLINLLIGQQLDPSWRDDATHLTDHGDPDFEAIEGKRVLRIHYRRERSPKLVKMAKQLFRSRHGRLFCEVCSFDFGEAYGEPEFIEAHHKVPLHRLEPGSVTKISDLAMVCANCHRMLHRITPWRTIEELMEIVQTAKSK